MLAVELWLSFFFGCYNGAMVVALTEVMPVNVRSPGFRLPTVSRRRSAASRRISTYLIQATGDKAAPAYWLIFAALCGFVATLSLYRRPTGGVQYAAPGAAVGG